MNTCSKVREAIDADPAGPADGAVDAAGSFAEHEAGCAECRSYRSGMQELDRNLKRAMTITVPKLRLPELSSIDTGSVAHFPRPRAKTLVWLAMAASIAFAAVIGFRTLGNDPAHLLPDRSLADEIIAHLDHEQGSLRVTDRAVSDDRLARIVPANIAAMDRFSSLVTYAQSCEINGTLVPHLVIQGQRGPVTILLMPYQKVDAAETINGQSINGVILPVGDGSIAIIGPPGEDLQQIGNSLKKSVTWGA